MAASPASASEDRGAGGGFVSVRQLRAPTRNAAALAVLSLLGLAFEATAQSSASPPDRTQIRTQTPAQPLTPVRTQPPPTLAILDFDLIDDQRDIAPDTTLGPRLAAIRRQLAEALARDGLYTVVDNAPAADMMQGFKSTQELHACNGCEREIGKALHADRVLVGWVQKVSNLILNINIQIEDVATGRVVLKKSVDLRGNTDDSWRRGIAYMVRDMVEKHQGSR